MKNPMQLAIQSARRGLRQGHGGPFGACIVRGRRILATAHNTVLVDRDPTAHAEMNAIRQACRKLGTHDLSGCRLYSTAEPCPMCLAAIYWAGIKVVVMGVTSAVPARFGFKDALIRSELKRPLARRQVTLRQGVMQAACLELFHEWQEHNGQIY